MARIKNNNFTRLLDQSQAAGQKEVLHSFQQDNFGSDQTKWIVLIVTHKFSYLVFFIMK